MAPAGYSGTSLAKKLGIKPGFRIRIENEPENYYRLFADFPDDVAETSDKTSPKDLIHFFTRSKKELQSQIKQLRNEIKLNGCIWISWPKQAAKMETDLNGNIVRQMGLENGLVDIKVCAVDEIWSGLKFVIPVKDRKKESRSS